MEFVKDYLVLIFFFFLLYRLSVNFQLAKLDLKELFAVRSRPNIYERILNAFEESYWNIYDETRMVCISNYEFTCGFLLCLSVLCRFILIRVSKRFLHSVQTCGFNFTVLSSAVACLLSVVVTFLLDFDSGVVELCFVSSFFVLWEKFTKHLEIESPIRFIT